MLMKRLIVRIALQVRIPGASCRQYVHIHVKFGPNAPKIAAWVVNRAEK